MIPHYALLFTGILHYSSPVFPYSSVIPPRFLGIFKSQPHPTRRIDPYASLANACTKLDLDDLRNADETPAQFLLRFVITHPDIHTIIVGTKNLDHLAENVAAAHTGALSEDVYQETIARLQSTGIKPGL